MNKVLNLGIYKQTDHLEAKQIQLINLMSILASSILFFSAVLNFSSDPPSIRLMELISASILLLSLYFNYKMWYTVAKTCFLAAGSFSLIVSFVFFGGESGIQFYFIDVMAIAFLVYSFKQWPISILLTLLIIGFYYAIDYSFAEGVLTPLKDKAALAIDFKVNLMLSGILLIIIMLFFNYLINVTEKLYKLQKEEYSKEEQLVQEVINASSNGIWVIDHNYKLIIFNKRYADFCATTFNGFKVHRGYSLKEKPNTGNADTDMLLNSYQLEWLPYYNSAIEGNTSTHLFELMSDAALVKIEVTFAPFHVKEYANGAIMYSKRL
jgi:PAS domain-containing protein